MRYLFLLAMARGHQAGCIEVVVRYQLVGCVCLTKVPFQPLMKLQVQGQVSQIVTKQGRFHMTHTYES